MAQPMISAMLQALSPDARPATAQPPRANRAMPIMRKTMRAAMEAARGGRTRRVIDRSRRDSRLRVIGSFLPAGSRRGRRP